MTASMTASSIFLWLKPKDNYLLWLITFPADALLDVPDYLCAIIESSHYNVPVRVAAIQPSKRGLRVSLQPDPHRITIKTVGRVPGKPNLVVCRDTRQTRGSRELLVKREIGNASHDHQL